MHLLSIFLISCHLKIVLANDENPNTASSNTSDNELFINPYNVREDGCPMVLERDKLNLDLLNGNWTLPYASLNWLAGIGMSLYNSSGKMSEVTEICPIITFSTTGTTKNAHAHWIIKVVCPKLKGEFQLLCWTNGADTQSKFICWNERKKRDVYLMIAATDHEGWILLVRCSPGDEVRPSEGMSWAILSKSVDIENDITEVLFGVLDGYGFDVYEFKSQLFYSDCPTSQNF